MSKLPDSLLQSLRTVTGFNENDFKQVHETGEKVTSIRINPLKLKDLSEYEMEERVPWSSHGYYLKERPVFTLDPLFHAGSYYVQEASGMFLEEALIQTVDITKSLKILDLCGAPGGKSTLTGSLISNDSLLVSNEPIRSRVNILQENITKWGITNSIVTCSDVREFASLVNYFDVMIVDAPCSGSGLFRKDPDAIKEWSEQNVSLCSQRQKRILADAYHALSRDGILIYCTCSYSKEENEDILDWLIDQFEFESLSLKIKDEWNIVQSVSDQFKAFGYRFYPDKLKGEGFFITCLKKTGGEYSSPGTSVKMNKITQKEFEMLNGWISKADHIILLKYYSEVLAFPSKIEKDLSLIQKYLYIRQSGTTVGTLLQNDFIPAHALALSPLADESIVRISLNKQQALQYLRKSDVSIQTTHKGWAIVQYEGYNLGWIKILANRINNYYPKEWRILMR